MLIVSALATTVALAAAGWIIAGILGHFVMSGLDRRLDADLALLASTIDRDGRVDDRRLGQVLGALAQGPGWRWRVRAPGRTVSSINFGDPVALPRPPRPPRLPGAPLPPEPADPRRPVPLELEEPGSGPMHARQLALQTRGGVVELLAAAPREVVQRPVRAALLPLLAALAVLAAILGAASIVQLRLALRPLRRLGQEIGAIRAGRLERVSEEQPLELRPLVQELNALAAHNSAALASARLSAANLAHALKTPVATLALDLRDDPVRAAQIGRMEATIRHHLARARLQTGRRHAAVALAPVLADVADAVMRLQRDGAPTIERDVHAAIRIAMDEQDLAELLGNLLDNAVRHARSHVTVRAALEADARRIRIEIADDGPGIPVADRAAVIQPGMRLDERAPGHGFGLAIVAELVALHGGALELRDASGGGLLVRATLPAAVVET